MVSLIYEKQEAKAKLSNCGKFLKTNLPSSYSNVMSGTGNDSLYGKNGLYEMKE
ncbi:hypothetical protein GCM10023339_69930 [Alloalcanivorax gelatiniphagus]